MCIPHSEHVSAQIERIGVAAATQKEEIGRKQQRRAPDAFLNLFSRGGPRMEKEKAHILFSPRRYEKTFHIFFFLPRSDSIRQFIGDVRDTGKKTKEKGSGNILCLRLYGSEEIKSPVVPRARATYFSPGKKKFFRGGYFLLLPAPLPGLSPPPKLSFCLCVCLSLETAARSFFKGGKLKALTLPFTDVCGTWCIGRIGFSS